MTGSSPSTRRSAWGRALEMAEQTPESRNRYVDLLRALSILAVVSGHWLIAAPWMKAGELQMDHMLDISAWTRWLTWIFQVMPIFFMVGGFSNSASWEATLRAGKPFGSWFASRVRRLIGPVLPLLVVWGLIGAVAHQFGVPAETIRLLSQAALVPLWFLAVYILISLFVPLTHRAWRAWGSTSFWLLVLAAVGIDLLRFVADRAAFGWLNYLFIWAAVHQMGYMWRAGRLGGLGRSLIWLVMGLGSLAFLVRVGGYPLSMVGVPGEEVSNTLPPSLAMLALGAAQSGLLLALEGPARRWLSRPRAWAGTILINGMIMSVYLWHLTAMILVVAISHAVGGFGLRLIPGSSAWWGSRPIWFAVLTATLLLFLTVVLRFERLPARGDAVSPPVWRCVPGAMLVCGGLALLAFYGIGGDGALGVRIWIWLPFVGALLVNGLPRALARSGA